MYHYRQSLTYLSTTSKHHQLSQQNLFIKRRFSSTPSFLTKHEKIYALPFKLSEERAPQIIELTNYITEHKFLGFFKLLKSMFLKTLPNVTDTSNIQMRKAYLPFWYYDMAIKATVKHTKSGEEREILCVGLDEYWVGHQWSPMCYLSLGFPISIDEKSLKPFNQIYQEIMENENDDDDDDENNKVKKDIEIIPFTTDPIQDLAKYIPTALKGFTIGKGTKHESELMNTELVFGAAYPLYFPVYIAQVDSDNKNGLHNILVIGGHSDNPTIFKFDPIDENNNNNKNKKMTLSGQWINGGQWIRLDTTDPSWRVGIPISPVQELCKQFMNKVVDRTDEPTLATAPRQPIPWDDDLRIQPFPHYQKENKNYIEQLFKVWAEQAMLTKLDTMNPDMKTIGVGEHGLEFLTAEKFKENILAKVGEELQKLESLEPQWLKDYNHQLIQQKKEHQQQLQQKDDE
ncbi:unnamed protein product [Cunninghamella blakesleeana]